MHPLHEKALFAVRRFREGQSELLSILQEIDREKIFLGMGYPSLYQYCLCSLRLSEATAANLITVARKSLEIPELKEAVHSGRITLAKARKIAPVLNVRNQDHWITLAESLPKDQLEKAVAEVRPKDGTPNRVTFLDGQRAELKVGVSNRFLEKLKSAQDTVSQRNQKNADYESTLEYGLDMILSDAAAPVHRTRKFQALVRDGHRCTFVGTDKIRCSATRWLDVHHILPRSEGGKDLLENLTTLCTAHHRLRHNENTA